MPRRVAPSLLAASTRSRFAQSSRGGMRGRPNPALQQTAGHDSFLRPIAHTAPPLLSYMFGGGGTDGGYPAVAGPNVRLPTMWSAGHVHLWLGTARPPGIGHRRLLDVPDAGTGERAAGACRGGNPRGRSVRDSPRGQTGAGATWLGDQRG